MAAVSAFSAEDFQRIQESLLEFKTQNYALSDQCRKQKSALGDSLARVKILEQDLEKAQRAIAKSKKAAEVQMLIQENGSLQRKLLSQEEEFRLQNQTLLTELSNLVSTNEKLEHELLGLHEPNALNEPFRPITAEISALKVENAAKTKEANMLREKLHLAAEENSRLKQIANANQARISQEVNTSEPSAHVNQDAVGAVVTFSRQSSRATAENEHTESFRVLQGENEKVTKERDEMRTALEKMQAQNVDLAQELGQKNNLLSQLQKDRNGQVDKLNEKIVEISELQQRDQKALEDLRQEKALVQAQLEKGYASFNEFKEKKTQEISTWQQQLESSVSKGVQLEQELDLAKKEIDGLKKQLDEAVKKSLKRKDLLDQMAISIQTKSEESAAKVLQLEEKLLSTENKSEELKLSLVTCKQRVLALEKSENILKDEVIKVQKKLDCANEEINTLKDKHKKELHHEKEAAQDMLNILEGEKKIAIRDLQMQLEIANVQKHEFEDACSLLKEEIRDLHEERKVVEKKSIALTKDLKRQLQAEKNRNDRLQEKMKEYPISDPCPPQRTREVDPDRTSISSWSMMSGHNEPNRSTPIPGSSSNGGDSLPTDSPISGRVSPAANDEIAVVEEEASNADRRLLLGKISRLQEERLVLEERLHMLQNSSSAMADELLKKTRIVQYYCMEGGKTGLATPTSPSTGIDKSLKKIVSILGQKDGDEKKISKMHNMLEESLTKCMQLEQSLNDMSIQLAQQSKLKDLGE